MTLSGVPGNRQSYIYFTPDGYQAQRFNITSGIPSRVGGGVYGDNKYLVIGTQESYIFEKRTPLLSNFSISNKILSDISFELLAPETDGCGNFVYETLDINLISISGNRVTLLQSGHATITATQTLTPFDASHTIPTISADFFIDKVETVLSNFLPIVTTYQFDLSIGLVSHDTNSDGVFSYESDNSLVVTISGDRLFIQGAGTATITAYQEETFYFHDASISLWY